MSAIKIELPNGNRLICGTGKYHEHGGFLKVENAEGRELGFWTSEEWESEGEGESVIGAAFRLAVGFGREEFPLGAL